MHLAGTETISGNKSGEREKDAAMSFLENALATVDAVAAREIVDPEKFKDGISKIIDGTVDCLNASTWAKGGVVLARDEPATSTTGDAEEHSLLGFIF